MEILPQYGLFLAKALTIAIVILFVVIGILMIASRSKDADNGKLKIKNLNDKFDKMRNTLNRAILAKHVLKNLLKNEKKTKKAEKKLTKKDNTTRRRVFVIKFSGDMRASATKALREEVTAVLTVANSKDEVVVCIDSPGGSVSGYGLAASQLQRIREHNIPLTACVDKVAASGGYMMACVANQIIAAPFAVIGSIGVVAQIPNFHRWLKQHNVDFEQITAGEYKRTLTLFGENTEKGRQKVQSEVDDTHELFKTFVSENRPVINIENLATGEYWYGARALNLQLVDHLQTSDDYLLATSKDADIFYMQYKTPKKALTKLTSSAKNAIEKWLFHNHNPMVD